MSGHDLIEPLLTAGETAELLKLSKSKIYGMAKRKEIPHFRLGKNIRFRATDLTKWLKNREEIPSDY
ncbi:MAG: helix-turn-helix domain-containing protein [Chloroflexota bacterium]